jgi:hypothetical protein
VFRVNMDDVGVCLASRGLFLSVLSGFEDCDEVRVGANFIKVSDMFPCVW